MLRITQIISPISRTPMLRQPMMLGRLPSSCLDHLYGYDHEAEFDLVMACRDGVNTASEALGRGAEIYGSRSQARWAYDERPAQQELTWQEIERNKQLEREARAEREWKAWEVKKAHHAITDRWRERSRAEAKAGRQFAIDYAAAWDEHGERLLAERRRERAQVIKAAREAAQAEREAKREAAEAAAKARREAKWDQTRIELAAREAQWKQRLAEQQREAADRDLRTSLRAADEALWKQREADDHARRAERAKREAADEAATRQQQIAREEELRSLSRRYLEKSNELINETLPQILTKQRIGHWSADHSFFLTWRQVVQLPPCFKCGGVFPAVDYNLLADGALGIRHQCQYCHLAIRYIVPQHARQQQELTQ